MAIGCTGVDIAQFQAANRVPLYHDQWNRWLLLRAIRDGETESDVLDSVAAVFAQWFKSESSWGWVIDAAIEWHGTTRSGGADLIHVVRMERHSISYQRADIVKTRIDVTPLPTLRPNASVMWIETMFAYRGFAKDMPWPVHKAQIVNPWCPLECDWALEQVATPPKEQPPPEQSSGEKATETIEHGLHYVADATVRFATPLLVGLGFGVAAYFGLSRRSNDRKK